MWWSGHKVIDPSELEARFSNEDSFGALDFSISDELSEESSAKLERVRNMLDLLPSREADFIELYYFNHMRQTDIATLFCVTQPTVCYRLQRAASRIKFLMALPNFTLDEIRQSLTGVFKDPLDVEIMLFMYETTCQSEVAKRLNVSQGLVRHRFIRSINKLKTKPDLSELLNVFESISKNLNILREVQRPTLPNNLFVVVH